MKNNNKLGVLTAGNLLPQGFPNRKREKIYRLQPMEETQNQ